MAAEVLSPERVRENNLTEDERDSGSPDPHDDADFGLDQAAQQHLADGALDPLATFILKSPEFNIDKANHFMHSKLLQAMDKDDIDITCFWQEGDCTKMQSSFADKSNRFC